MKRPLFISLVTIYVFIIIGCSDDNHELHAYVISQNYIENILKSPSTADFPSLNYARVVDHGDNTFTIRSYVDSQNGFGATLRTKYMVKLSWNGKEWSHNKNWTLLDIHTY